MAYVKKVWHCCQKVLWTPVHPKRAGQFISSVLPWCLDGTSLLSRRRGYLPLTKYSKHPFRLVMGVLGGKETRKKVRYYLERSILQMPSGGIEYMSLFLCRWLWTYLCRTACCFIRVVLCGHYEVESSLPALLMKSFASVQTGARRWIFPYRNPGTPVSVLSQGVKCISMQRPVLKYQKQILKYPKTRKDPCNNTSWMWIKWNSFLKVEMMTRDSLAKIKSIWHQHFNCWHQCIMVISSQQQTWHLPLKQVS